MILFVRSAAILRILLLSLIAACLVVLVVGGLSKREWRLRHRRGSALIIFLLVLGAVLVMAVTLPEKNFPWTLVYSVPLSMAIWLTATLVTRPVDEDQLIRFYRRVHPGGPGWKHIAAKTSGDFSAGVLFTRKNILGFLFGSLATYCALIGFGQLMLGRTLSGVVLMVVMALSIVMVVINLSGEKWGSGSGNRGLGTGG